MSTKKSHNLTRKKHYVRNAFTPEVECGSLRIRESDADEHSIRVILDDWQIRDLARNCIRYLDERAGSAKRLAEQARVP